MSCTGDIIEIGTTALGLPANTGVLIVLGRYSGVCNVKTNHGIIFSKRWISKKHATQIYVSDPEEDEISGNFTIKLGSALHFTQKPHDPELYIPFPIKFDLSRKIVLSKQKLVIDCNPCRVHGTAIIDISVHGELFKPNPAVKTKIGLVMESEFYLKTFMENGLDDVESITLLNIPLVPLVIPNLISIGPSFIVNLKAVAKSNSNVVISAEQLMKSGKYNADFYHEGLDGKVIVYPDQYSPIQKGKSSAIFTSQPTVRSSGVIKLVLEFNPSLQMSISVFGNQVSQAAKAEVGHVFTVNSKDDSACPSGFAIEAMAEATLSGRIGDTQAPRTSLSKKPVVAVEAVPPPAFRNVRLIHEGDTKIPSLAIVDASSLAFWLKSKAFFRLLEFIQKLNFHSIDKKLGSTQSSVAVQKTVALIRTLTEYMDDFPPLESNQRFGNLAFREWNKKMQENAYALTRELLGNSKYSEEISVYLAGAFGNGQRIDYGSGHELSFVAWLCCLDLIGFYDDSDACSLVLEVFQAYLVLVRKLQTTYTLEPAGSHGILLALTLGVWGLDDFQFLAYYWGSAQLLNHKNILPKSIMQQDIVNYYAKDYIYLACIKYILESKKGPFYEHSPMLYDISGVPMWTKVNSGLLKMYVVEVLSKYPIMQHFLFGAILPFEEEDCVK